MNHTKGVSTLHRCRLLLPGLPRKVELVNFHLHHRTVDEAIDHDSTVAIADSIADHEGIHHVTVRVVGTTNMGGVDLTEGAIDP